MSIEEYNYMSRFMVLIFLVFSMKLLLQVEKNIADNSAISFIYFFQNKKHSKQLVFGANV